MRNTTRNIYWIIAGFINFFTAILHIVGGQIDLVNPLLSSSMNLQVKTEWMGVWHMITIFLLVSSFYCLKHGVHPPKNNDQILVLKFIGIMYVFFSFSFIACSLFLQTLASQWILLFPIGIFTLLGVRKHINHE